MALPVDRLGNDPQCPAIDLFEVEPLSHRRSKPGRGIDAARHASGATLRRTSEMPLDRAPPRSNRFGSPLVLSRVHWVRPELVVEVKYLTWTQDNLLRQVAYQGVREDKDPSEVRRPAGQSLS